MKGSRVRQYTTQGRRQNTYIVDFFTVDFSDTTLRFPLFLSPPFLRESILYCVE